MNLEKNYEVSYWFSISETTQKLKIFNGSKLECIKFVRENKNLDWFFDEPYISSINY